MKKEEIRELNRRRDYLCSLHTDKKTHRRLCYTSNCPLAKAMCWDYSGVQEMKNVTRECKSKGLRSIIDYLRKLEVPEDWEPEEDAIHEYHV